IWADPANGELLAANFLGPTITVYSRTADGDTGPLRTLSGAATGLSGPYFVVVPAAVATATPTPTPTQTPVPPTATRTPLPAVAPRLDARGLLALTLILAAAGALAPLRMKPYPRPRPVGAGPGLGSVVQIVYYCRRTAAPSRLVCRRSSVSEVNRSS